MSSSTNMITSMAEAKKIGCRFKLSAECLKSLVKEHSLRLDKEIYCLDIANSAIYAGEYDGHKVVIKLTALYPRPDIKKKMSTILKYTDILAEKNISPAVYSRFFCKGFHKISDESSWEEVNIFIIVMDKFDMSLTTYYKKYNKTWENVKDIVSDVIRKMNALGVEHNDLYSRNVLVKVDNLGNIYDVKIIDYEDAKFYDIAIKSDNDLESISNETPDDSDYVD